MALLEQIQGPQDLKKLRRDQLPELAREVRTRLIMQREKARRDRMIPRRTSRESVIWEQIAGHDAALYERELEWLKGLRTALEEVEG